MRIRLDATAPARITADRAARRITGVLLPFGVEGRPSVGPARITVTADAALTIDEGMVLNLEHDPSRPIGRCIASHVGSDGLVATFTVVDTTTGADALVEASEGLRTGLSIEAVDVQGHDVDGLFHITAARIAEAALVRHAAFPEALVTDVAATAATIQQEETVEDPTPAVEAPETAPEIQAAAPIPMPHNRTAALPTAGEFVLATWNRDRDSIDQYRRRISAAAPHTFLADIPGLIPEPLVGPVLDLTPGGSPVFNALGPALDLARTPGNKGRIPMVTTPLLDAAVATEKADVTRPFVIEDVEYTKEVIKRAWNLSVEAVLFSTPSAVTEGLKLLNKSVVRGSEAYVVSKLEAVTGTNAAIELAADGSDLWAKLAAGVSAYQAACGQEPSHFVVARDVWAQLVGMTNSLGAPLIPTLNQTLVGDWGSLFGIPVVVSWAITAGKAFLVSDSGVKAVSGSEVRMQVDEPTIEGVAAGASKVVGLAVASPKFITPVTIAAP
jgi:hypothetical protein